MTPYYFEKRINELEERIKRLENKDRRLGPSPSPYDLQAGATMISRIKKKATR